jgi:hypothetical protein
MERVPLAVPDPGHQGATRCNKSAKRGAKVAPIATLAHNPPAKPPSEHR